MRKVKTIKIKQNIRSVEIKGCKEECKNLTTKLKGILGSEEIDGDGGEGGLSSLARIACCNCSYLGPLRYRSKVMVTIGPVFRSISTAW